MDMYVRNMEIPKNCHQCKIAGVICRHLWKECDRFEERYSDCPLVEMPELSGRIAIIDFNSALLKLNSLFNDCIKRKIQPNKDDFEMALNVLTIIEEER